MDYYLLLSTIRLHEKNTVVGTDSQLVAGGGAYQAVTGTISHSLSKQGLPKGLTEAGDAASWFRMAGSATETGS